MQESVYLFCGSSRELNTKVLLSIPHPEQPTSRNIGNMLSRTQSTGLANDIMQYTSRMQIYNG